MSLLSANERFVGGMKKFESKGNGGGLAYRVVIVFGRIVCADGRGRFLFKLQSAAIRSNDPLMPNKANSRGGAG